MKKVIILGGLGNGSVIANAIIDANQRGFNELEFAGFLNDREKKNSKIEGLPVIGKLSDVKDFLEKGFYFINTIYRIEGQQERIEFFQNLHIPKTALATFIHPLAYIAPNVELGTGSVIMPNSSISSGTKFGKCCLVMVGATIGHNNSIGDHCHFAAQSCTSSYIKIAEGVHIGLNACVRETLSIGKNSTLGMGSVLLQNIGNDEIWAGNPARFIRKAK
jgi:acetyltransferase EpsM